VKLFDPSCICQKRNLATKNNAGILCCLFSRRSKVSVQRVTYNLFPNIQLASTVSKVNTFRYATYPSGWFFIRSYVQKSTTESPLVLTATESSVDLTLLDRHNWQHQLWSYSSGKLTNYATDLVIDCNCKCILLWVDIKITNTYFSISF
jgi:hypothetical protein